MRRFIFLMFIIFVIANSYATDEFDAAVLREAAKLREDLKPGSARSNLPTEDQRAFDRLRENGYSVDEAKQKASTLRKICEQNGGGAGCRY